MYTIIVSNTSNGEDEIYLIEGKDIYIKTVSWNNMDEYKEYWDDPKNNINLDITPIRAGQGEKNYHRKIDKGGCSVMLVYYSDKNGYRGMISYSDEWNLIIQNDKGVVVSNRRGM